MDRREESLKRDTEKKPLDKAKLLEAEAKADAKQDIRFWFGRYRGLGKEDYFGLGCVTLIFMRMSCIGNSTYGLRLMERFKTEPKAQKER